MRVYYDEEGDFLEISIGKPSKSIAEEVESGVFIRKDEKTKEVKSIGILSFKKRTERLQEVDISLPVQLQISS